MDKQHVQLQPLLPSLITCSQVVPKELLIEGARVQRILLLQTVQLQVCQRKLYLHRTSQMNSLRLQWQLSLKDLKLTAMKKSLIMHNV